MLRKRRNRPSQMAGRGGLRPVFFPKLGSVSRLRLTGAFLASAPKGIIPDQDPIRGGSELQDIALETALLGDAVFKFLPRAGEVSRLAPTQEGVEGARRIVALLKSRAIGEGSWTPPNCTVSPDGEIVLEWWTGCRKATVYVTERSAEFVKVWGSDPGSEMEEGTLDSAESVWRLWDWLAVGSGPAPLLLPKGPSSRVIGRGEVRWGAAASSSSNLLMPSLRP